MRIDLLALTFSPSTVEGSDAQSADPKVAEGFLSAMNEADSALNDLNPVPSADAPQVVEPDQAGASNGVPLIADLGVASCCVPAQDAMPVTECSPGSKVNATGGTDEESEKQESVSTTPAASTPSDVVAPSPVAIPSALTVVALPVFPPMVTPPVGPPPEASQTAGDSETLPEEPAGQTASGTPVVQTPSGIPLPPASRDVRTPLFPVPGFARALEIRSEAARTVSNAVPLACEIGNEARIPEISQIRVPVSAGSEASWSSAPQIEETGNPAEAVADGARGDGETSGIISTGATAGPVTEGTAAESGDASGVATPSPLEPAVRATVPPVPSRSVARKSEAADEARAGEDCSVTVGPSGRNSADAGVHRLSAEVPQDRERLAIFTPVVRASAGRTAVARDSQGVETQKEKSSDSIAPSSPTAGRESAPGAGLFEKVVEQAAVRIEPAGGGKQEETGDTAAGRNPTDRTEVRPAVVDVLKRGGDARKPEPEAFRPVLAAAATSIKVPREVLEPHVQEKVQGSASLSTSAPGQVVAAAARGASSRAAAPVAEAHPPEFIIQLAQRIQAQADAGGGGLRIQLRPANLGRVEITAEPGVAGLVARIVTESSAVRQYLEGNLHVLERALTDQGLRVDRLDVVMQSFDFRHSTGQQQQAGGSGTHHDRGVGAGLDGRGAEEAEIIADPLVLNVLGPNSTFHTVA